MSGSTVPPQPPTGKQQDSDEQIRALEQQVAQLRGESASQSATAPKPKSGHRIRTFWSVVPITVACLLAPISVVAVWANGEVSNTDRYVATVAPLASDPAIQQAVSARVSTAILQRLDVPALTQQAVSAITDNRNLDPRKTAALTALAGAVNGGVEGLIKDKVTQVVQSPQFATLWTQANTKAHEQINAALSGEDSGAVQIQNDEIVLDLGDVVAAVKTKLVDDGLTVAEKIPTVDTQIVLFQSNSISRVQTAYSALDKIGTWLPIVAALLALIGVFVAKDSRKGLLGFGIGLTLSMAASGLAFGFFRMELLNNLPPTASASATTALVDQVSYSHAPGALGSSCRPGPDPGRHSDRTHQVRDWYPGPREPRGRCRPASACQLGCDDGHRSQMGCRSSGGVADRCLDRRDSRHHVAAVQDSGSHSLGGRGSAGGAVVIQVLASGVEDETDQADEPQPAVPRSNAGPAEYCSSANTTAGTPPSARWSRRQHRECKMGVGLLRCPPTTRTT